MVISLYRIVSRYQLYTVVRYIVIFFVCEQIAAQSLLPIGVKLSFKDQGLQLSGNGKSRLSFLQKENVRYFKFYEGGQLVAEKEYHPSSFIHRYRCYQQWCTRRYDFAGETTHVYQNGRWLKSIMRDEFQSMVSSADDKSCGAAAPAHFDFQNITNTVETTLSQLSTERIQVKQGCEKLKGSDKDIANTTIQSIQAGVSCLMQQGEKSKRDALNLISLFYQDHPFTIDCLPGNQSRKISEAGRQRCIRLGSSYGMMPGMCHQEFPLILINSDHQYGDSLAGITFHEAFHALGYFHGGEDLDITYLAHMCCFTPKDYDSSNKAKACKLLNHRDLSVQSLKDYQDIMSDSGYGSWKDMYLHNTVRSKINSIPFGLFKRPAEKRKFLFSGLKMLERHLKRRKSKNTLVDDYFQYYNLLLYKRHISKSDQGSRDKYDKLKKQLESKMKNKNLQKIIEHTSNLYLPRGHGVLAIEHRRNMNSINDIYNNICKNDEKIDPKLTKALSSNISFNDSTNDKWKILMRYGSDCKNRPAKLNDYIEKKRLANPKDTNCL